MTNKVALKILEIEKDKLMSEPESNRDWELITALDIVINALKNEPFLTDALNKAHAEIKEMDDRVEFLKQQIRLWQSTEQHESDCVDEISLERLQEEQPPGEWNYGEDKYGQDGWFCSKCGFFVPWYYQFYKNSDFIRDYKVCPYCESKMITYTGKMEADIETDN